MRDTITMGDREMLQGTRRRLRGGKMKNIVTYGFICCALLLVFGCAGMDSQYQRNLFTNGALWGVIGAGTGAGVAAITGGDIRKGAAIGGISGVYAGMAGTPRPSTPGTTYSSGPVYGGYRPMPAYTSPHEQSYAEEIERLRRQEHHNWAYRERARGVNDARDDFYGR